MKARVLTGLDQLGLAEEKLRGRRVGLMTNPTGIDRDFRSAIDILFENYSLSALFACEHGVRGDRQAGASIEPFEDPDTGVMVYSCYGNTRRLTEGMLAAFDVLVFDMQDVGARFYTYLYSLSYAMEACARAGKPVIVLDRPNPVGGERVSGTVLQKKFHSFVGEYELPTRYALTIGEYALWVRDHLRLKLDLTVIPLSGWRREMYQDDTDLPFIAPSPNIPTVGAAVLYGGTCVFEGTNLSEGRGTTLPFELIGAPYVNSRELEKRMAALQLPGLHFRRASFTPQFSKWAGETCHGVQVHVTDRKAADPFGGGLMLLEQIRSLHPDAFEWRQPETGDIFTIDRLLGTDDYRKGKLDVRGLINAHQPLLDEFTAQKKRFELYS